MKYDLEARLSTKEAAKVLNVSASYLNKARVFGTGPKYEKYGKLVRYRYGTLLESASSQSRRSTSDIPKRDGLAAVENFPREGRTSTR